MNEEKKEIRVFVEEYEVEEVPAKHPSLFEPRTLIFGALMGVLGIIIGLELLTRVGITPNTSIIAAIIAMGVARIPVTVLASFRSLPRQNLLQTVISGATFAGANGILLPMGVLWLVGRMDLVPVMMLGAVLGIVIDITILYKVFDSKIYPAQGIWPPGIATAECMIAGDRGGRRGILLAIGAVVGGIGRYIGYPMDIFGVCWIGNIWALTMFGIGLLVRGYSPAVIGVDINKLYVPHGVMIGAGVVALIQIIISITKRETKSAEELEYKTTGKQFGQALGGGFVAFIIAAVVLAAVAGIYAEMSVGALIGFVIFAALAALVSELIVGISAMHAGWFPAFATALIFLVIGMIMGFPPLPLAFLVGFTASTGPAFADMGYDLKTGWILRGSGKYPEFEKQGRRQQYLAELLGVAVAVVVILLFYKNYFTADLFPPVDRVYAATIKAGTSPEVAKYLLLWAIPGAIIQLIGGPARQIGILFATGLLINYPVAGWTALVALAIRATLIWKYGERIQSPMYVLGGGFIAGAALTSFGTATLKAAK
jgi:uncharacterized oligopeptide transporter (OPT) family protein